MGLSSDLLLGDEERPCCPNERFDIINDFYKVRKIKKEILRYNNVNDCIDPKGWSVYDILDDVDYDKIREIYDQYFKFDNFYISNDKNEFN